MGGDGRGSIRGDEKGDRGTAVDGEDGETGGCGGGVFVCDEGWELYGQCDWDGWGWGVGLGVLLDRGEQPPLQFSYIG